LPSPCYVLSDAHVGVEAAGKSGPGSTERALLDFLADRRDGSLVINGDLFDFWFEWRTVIPRAGFRLLAALATLHDRGVPVLWVAGNHDCWGGDVLRQDVGVDYHIGPWEGTLAGWRTRIEHGDGLRGREDRGYRAIRPILRNPLAIRAFRLLPADWASRLASGSSQASRTYRARDKGAALRAVAAATLSGPGAPELFILGHSHVPALERLGAGIYANAGTWIDNTYLMITPERIALCTYPGPASSIERQELLNSVDRSVLTKEQPPGAEEPLRIVGGDETMSRSR
jgi:UDP-2,3-diacylglucosamine hydrolase